MGRGGTEAPRGRLALPGFLIRDRPRSGADFASSSFASDREPMVAEAGRPCFFADKPNHSSTP